MPSKRTLQNYTYPEDEVENVIKLKKENAELPTEYLKEKYGHFILNPEANKLQYRKRTLVQNGQEICPPKRQYSRLS